VAYIVDRYGEYVLLEPTKDGANMILWLAAPALLIAALGIGYGAIRARASAEAPDGLSDDEEARLSELLGKR